MKFSILISSILFIWIFGQRTAHSETFTEGHKQFKIQEDVKDLAFTVLKAKCNVCHATKKRTDIFTLANMDSLAADIHKQVFIKKKMPKGRKVKLTDEERQLLQNWLSTVVKNRESVD